MADDEIDGAGATPSELDLAADGEEMFGDGGFFDLEGRASTPGEHTLTELPGEPGGELAGAARPSLQPVVFGAGAMVGLLGGGLAATIPVVKLPAAAPPPKKLPGTGVPSVKKAPAEKAKPGAGGKGGPPKPTAIVAADPSTPRGRHSVASLAADLGVMQTSVAVLMSKMDQVLAVAAGKAPPAASSAAQRLAPKAESQLGGGASSLLYLGGPLGTSPLAAPDRLRQKVKIPTRPHAEGVHPSPNAKALVVAEEEEEEDEGLGLAEEEDGGAAGSTNAMILNTMIVQSKALQAVVEALPDSSKKKKEKRIRRKLLSADSSSSSDDSEEDSKLKGTKGQIAMLAFKRTKRPKRVRKFVRTLLRNIAEACNTEISPGLLERFFKERMCLAGHKTLALSLWLKVAPADSLLRAILSFEKKPVVRQVPTPEEEESEYRMYLAMAELLLAIGATEQAVRDNGRWARAWHLTLAPELPWAYVNRSVASITEEESNVSPVFTDAMVAAVNSFRKEMRAEDEEKTPGAGRRRRGNQGQDGAEPKAKAKAKAKG